ncbi:leucine Rich Repeat domain-containing protein [Coccidioides immitis RS]|uniref:Leucine Rich Repeat domain-containing protein n=2 Tax=Coccidioides immitis TaxID=5501 RepID=A0A0E1S3K5_COCIM|nr:leucine Rich Repeat domain-containing protein [Coccidioides immitis RS]EAS33875.2 leucine Rich Repeat domain-containing protein [Coccidioides immitis RS]KMU77600.1 leucine Rich Repeat domain -containing protein [Coccidioides immitis RMSCC 3703]TPX21486.1 hypothetical protein DIZ76_015444 [Coccidioides immitis]
MEKLNTEDGQLFIKNLARFVRTHEKALANALQMRRQTSKSLDSSISPPITGRHGSSSRSATSSSLAAVFSLGSLSFTSHNIKPAKLTLTPHHVFYLLSRFEELSVPVGPMNIRLENINTEASSAYVSFLNKPRRPKGDRDSIHSVSSVRSVLSGMSVFWSSFGLGSKDSVSKSDKARAAIESDLKYLYSAFTKIPCLRLAPDHRARLIRGYEEFPFDTAVPLHAFKNLGSLEIIDVDFRSFYGWDRLAEQLRTLTLKRASVDDVGDLLTGIVLDDIDKRRRRSTRNPQSPVSGGTTASPVTQPEPVRASSAPGSPVSDHNFGNRSSPKCGSAMVRAGSAEGLKQRREGSASPPRPPSSRRRHIRGASTKIKRSGSGSSNSSECSTVYRHRSMSNLLAAGILPSTKWRFLRHLGLPDNSMTSITAISLAPVANTLHSLDLSWNLFTEVPDSLSTLVALRSLNLSHCMIGSLHSLSRNPLPAITALNLRANRLRSIAGVERLLSLERLDLRENNIPDPTEMARLTSIPYLREIWVAGNPFTKSHSDYRVTIFNLFRRTPGFSEDILIDGSGPTYSERKKLVERVAEPESAPVIRPNEQANSREDDVLIAEPVITQCAQPKALEEKATNPASIRKQEHAVGSTRRKKPHRRRIVDLSQDESRDTLASEIVEPTTPKSESPFQERQDTLTRPALPRLNTGSDSVSPVLSKVAGAGSAAHFLPAIEGVDWDSSGDIYRQRLEALKQEVGTNWLTVLDDETWGGKQRDIGFPSSDGSGLHPVGPIHPHRMTGATGHAIASSGRTLG